MVAFAAFLLGTWVGLLILGPRMYSQKSDVEMAELSLQWTDYLRDRHDLRP